MEKLLEFIYSDKVTNLPHFAMDLFAAADKYAIPVLVKMISGSKFSLNLKQIFFFQRDMCRDSIVANIKVENAAEVLVLGYLHESLSLKAKSMDFVTKNMSAVSETDAWKKLVKTHPNILQEILLKEFARPQNPYSN